MARHQLAAWAGAPGAAHLTLALNVSACQLRYSDFIEQMLALLTRSGANPFRLKPEISESMLLDNVEQVIAKVGA